jgi:hypothetical protein
MDNWCFIIPYRDREEHLKRFVSHYGSLFPDVPIIVVEQQPNTPFNRAKLFNVGFLEYGRYYDWAAYHDVDMYVYPDYTYRYDYPEMPTHIATRCEQFDYKQPYEEYSGGVILINKEQMILANGFSNLFNGYGCEDDEMRENLVSNGFNVKHLDCFFKCADHLRSADPTLYKRNLSMLKRGRPLNDGLTTCHYKVNSREQKEGYTILKVNI